MFNKILIALDHGDTCRSLFDQAVALAQSTQADLMLLSVLTPEGDGSLAIPSFSGTGYYPMSMDENLWEVYTERYREYEMAGLRRLRSFTDKAMTLGVQTEFTQVSGNPGPAICELAKTWNADLIMVGSHGRRGFDELLMGSVSNYVMHHAPCSVLVVHKSKFSDTLTSATEMMAAK
ncbi:MAG: universal stress protein [Cyanobacteria bacterium J06628_6]